MKKVVLCLGFTILLGLANAQTIKKGSERRFRLADLFNPYAHPMSSLTSLTIGVGFSTYSGEISDFSDFSKQRYHLNPTINLGFLHRLTDHLSLRIEASYVNLYSESVVKSIESYKFNSHNFDITSQLQIDWLPKTLVESKYRNWNVYILGGIGVVRFNPKDVDSGITLINDNSSKVAMVFPIGIGISFVKSKMLDIGFEVSRKFTQTDQLEGVIIANTLPNYDQYMVYGLKANLSIFKRFNYGKYLKRLGH